ncbi:MAG: hypothetical protein VB089_12425 [Anaerolineaceae bacterium]|nr:hypothetical protein [Anaerolineaceae bacterium]
MTDSEQNDTRIAFVDINVFDDGSIRGGVLVTDIATRPFEFRVTSPVKPTQLQRILYGSSLTEYVYGELIALPLLKSVKEKVTLAVCRNDHLLIARPGLQFPFVVVKKQQSIKNNGINPISIHPHRNFVNEQAHAELLLNAVIERHDIYEPFERVKVAVNEVNQNKVEQQKA